MTPVRRALTMAVCVMSAMCSMTVWADAQSRVSEYHVKAAFLYNLAKFVQWPPSADRSDQLVVCVIGNEFFSTLLHDLVKGKSVQDRAIIVRGPRKGDDLHACHMVFVSAIESRNTADILLRVPAAGVLTVGETPDFVREGGLARFYVENNRMRVEIDAAAADQAGLKIQSQLLSLARR